MILSTISTDEYGYSSKTRQIYSFGLTLNAPITTAADDSFYFFFYFSEKTSLDIPCESSAKQTIHMKCQDLFSLKNKKKKKKKKKRNRMSSAKNFAWRFKG